MIPDTMTDRFPLSGGYEDGGGGGGRGYGGGGGCIELRSGSVTLIGGSGGGGSPSRNLRVILKVYRTSLEHFAVLYPDKLVTCCKPIGFINLKHCNVGCWRRTLQIVQRSCDGGVLTFDCGDAKETKLWLDVMENKTAKNNSTFSSTTLNTSNSTSSGGGGQCSSNGLKSGTGNNVKSKQLRMNICNNLNLPIVQEEAADEE